jgi:hypothetical protein
MAKKGESNNCFENTTYTSLLRPFLYTKMIYSVFPYHDLSKTMHHGFPQGYIIKGNIIDGGLNMGKSRLG